MSKMTFLLDPRSDFEVKTRELFSTVEWSPTNTMVAQIFVTDWASALTRADIEARACARFSISSVDLSSTLTALVRAKILRSYDRRGRRLYEVNY